MASTASLQSTQPSQPDTQSVTNDEWDEEFWRNHFICDYLHDGSSAQLKVVCGLDLYFPPIIFIVGLVSNTFVILVMRSKYFRTLSTSFYMVVNAITDSVSILIALPAHYISVNFPHAFDNARHFHPMCSFFLVFGWATSDLGVLFTVAMTTERALAIKYPLQAYKLCTVRRAKFVVIGLTIFDLIKLCHFAIMGRVITNSTSMLCTVSKSSATYNEFYSKVWPWLHFSMLLASYAIVIVGNVIIVVNIKNSSQGKGTEGIGRKTVREDSRTGSKNRQLSIMLVIDSCSLVICTLPYSIFNILVDMFRLDTSLPGGKNLVFSIVFYLLYVNRCLNFFLYCVSGTRFRIALRKIFTSSSLNSLTDWQSARDGSPSKRSTYNRNSNRRTLTPGLSSDDVTSQSQETLSTNAFSKSTQDKSPNGSANREFVNPNPDPTRPSLVSQKTSEGTRPSSRPILSRPKYLTAGGSKTNDEQTSPNTIDSSEIKNSTKSKDSSIYFIHRPEMDGEYTSMDTLTRRVPIAHETSPQGTSDDIFPSHSCFPGFTNKAFDAEDTLESQTTYL